MSDIHRRVFTLFLMEQDRLALNPAQRSEMQAHLSTCSSCQANLKLYQGVKAQANLSWREAAPQIDMEKLLRSKQVRIRGFWKSIPVQAAIWIGLGLLALILLRWIFTDLRPSQAVKPAVDSAHNPSATPGLSTPVSTPSPTGYEMGKIPIEPFWRGDPSYNSSWSPDDQTLFMLIVDSPPQGGDRLTTSLHFISAATGEDCPASETFLRQQGSQSFTWLDNERVLFIDNKGRALVFTRCQPGDQDISGSFAEALLRVAMPDINQELASPGPVLLEGTSAYWLLDPVSLQAHPLAEPLPTPGQVDGFSWIPSGHRISVIQPVAGEPDLSRLALLDLDSGDVLRSVEIEASLEGGTPQVEWMGPELAYIWSMATTGPVMVDLAVDPPRQIRVFPKLFGLNLTYPDDISSMGVFYSPASGSYHIVFQASLLDGNSIYIYHGEDGKVEKLAGDRQVLLIFPGDQLMAQAPMQDSPSHADEYDVVWVDEPEQPSIHLQVGGHTPRNAINLECRLIPGSKRILFGSTQGISMVDLTSGETQAFWQLSGAEDALFPTIRITPDGLGAIVSVTAYSSAAKDSLVYWLPLTDIPPTTRQVTGTQGLPAITPTSQAMAATQPPEAAIPPQVFAAPEAQVSTYISMTLLSKDDPTHAHWVDYFGGSVDIDGDILATGAPIWGRPPGEGTGAAYVYRRSPSGDWQLEATLIASDRDDGFQYDQHFGESIAVNGTTIAVGAPGYDDPQAGDNVGAVYIYEYDGHAWVETGKLISDHPTSGAKIGASIAYDGVYLAASGSPEAGFVSIFQHETGGWREAAQVPVPASSDGNPYVLLDLCGKSLAVSTITWEIPDNASDVGLLRRSGMVTLYERDGDQWIQIYQTPPQEASLYRMYGEEPFGLPVALGGEAGTGRANWLAVGKPGFPGSGRETGSVAIFERGGLGWTLQTELMLAPGEQVPGTMPAVSPEPGATFFGAFVRSDVGNRLAVISTFANTVYVFERQGVDWIYRYLVTPAPGFGDDFQRRTVAMSGDDMLLGSPGELGGGELFVFNLP